MKYREVPESLPNSHCWITDCFSEDKTKGTENTIKKLSVILCQVNTWLLGLPEGVENFHPSKLHKQFTKLLHQLQGGNKLKIERSYQHKSPCQEIVPTPVLYFFIKDTELCWEVIITGIEPQEQKTFCLRNIQRNVIFLLNLCYAIETEIPYGKYSTFKYFPFIWDICIFSTLIFTSS